MSYSDTEESDVEVDEEDKTLQEIVHACKHGWDWNIDPCWSFPVCPNMLFQTYTHFEWLV